MSKILICIMCTSFFRIQEYENTGVVTRVITTP